MMDTPRRARRERTFPQKVALGFTALVGLAVIIATVALVGLSSVVDVNERVLERDARALLDAARANGAIDAFVASVRGYLISPDPELRARAEASRQVALGHLAELDRDDEHHDPATSVAVARILALEGTYHTAVSRLVQVRDTSADLQTIARSFERDTVPHRRALDDALADFVTKAERRLGDERRRADARTDVVVALVIGLAGLAIALAVALAWTLVRALTRQIGSHVQHVQSSAAELQTAANQQTTSASETSSAMTEIATTINELLVTSRQITESAQRVAQIALEGASAAEQGDQTMREAEDSMEKIRHQIDAVVSHMLELGRKSQQIGQILDIINELADQTNILAINATIEAAGAGEHGARFAVVGDEIRKLADRVGGSAREVRRLVDEIRAAVNTTVMVTEGGSKSVDAGRRQFGDVTEVFSRIASVVTTTSAAGREIELSTKQQQTAVEQVNVAIGGVVQATRENEAALGQILSTATQLTDLSRDLSRLVQDAP